MAAPSVTSSFSSLDRVIAELEASVDRAFATSKTEQQLQALNDAFKLLDDASDEIAGKYASSLPYARVSSAKRYIRKQADELLAPIFEEASHD